MTSLLFVAAAALGMALPVLVFAFWGSSMVVMIGLLLLMGLFGALYFAIERSWSIDSD